MYVISLPKPRLRFIFGAIFKQTHLGSMLWSQFSTIFVAKIGVFLKNQCYDQNFALFSFVLSPKRQFFRWIFWRKYLKNQNIRTRYKWQIFSCFRRKMGRPKKTGKEIKCSISIIWSRQIEFLGLPRDFFLRTILLQWHCVCFID
jgi:hypothetical protein